MRKLFRFKYEPCNGTCYAYCAILPEELNRLEETERHQVVDKMVTAHNRLCDNPDYSFGVDMDDKSKAFVAHFRKPSETQLLYGPSFKEAVEKVCGTVMETHIPKVDGKCVYGDNGAEDLGREILQACSDPEFLRKHHERCPCSQAVVIDLTV